MPRPIFSPGFLAAQEALRSKQLIESMLDTEVEWNTCKRVAYSSVSPEVRLFFSAAMHVFFAQRSRLWHHRYTTTAHITTRV